MRTPTDLHLDITIRGGSSPLDWDESGVDGWSVVAWASDGSDNVEIARLAIYRVNNQRCIDPVFDLANISPDLSEMADAIYLREYAALRNHLGFGWPVDLLIVDRAAVDPHWRGRRLGPSLVHWASESLRADLVFLYPAAVGTHRSTGGSIHLNYDAQGTPEDRVKVVKAWRRAGFKRLNSTVMWRSTDHTYDLRVARKGLERFERDLQTSDGLAWFRRKLRQQTRR